MAGLDEESCRGCLICSIALFVLLCAALCCCRDNFKADSSLVKAAATAAYQRLVEEVAAVKADLEAQLEAVKSEAAKAAARAKVQRQNAHIADREARQAEWKEMITGR